MTAASEVLLEDVTVRYGPNVAVHGVRARFAPGAITAILGPSGCGKTTLLYAINRLHDLSGDATVSGRITIGGVSVTDRDPDALRLEVGLILQRPVPFPMSIWDNLAFPLRLHGVARADVDRRVRDALHQAALWPEVCDRLQAPASQLSGGQQQRLCLARSLALAPTVLLLDEPCAALDPASTALVEQTLQALDGTTRVLVTHNLAQARRLASRCLCLWPGPDGGVVVDEGPIERVFDEPATPELRAWFSGAIG